MKTQVQRTYRVTAAGKRNGDAHWKTFVRQHWLLGHKVLKELSILIRLAEPVSPRTNGHPWRRVTGLRIKRA